MTFHIPDIYILLLYLPSEMENQSRKDINTVKLYWTILRIACVPIAMQV